MMEQALQKILKEKFNKTLETADSREIYIALLTFTRDKMADMPLNEGSASCIMFPRNSSLASCSPTTLINLGLFERSPRAAPPLRP